MLPFNGLLLLAIKLVELINKINVLIWSDHDDTEYNYKFNVFNNCILISTLISIVNERISISLPNDNFMQFWIDFT